MKGATALHSLRYC